MYAVSILLQYLSPTGGETDIISDLLILCTVLYSNDTKKVIGLDCRPGDLSRFRSGATTGSHEAKRQDYLK
jgi:hypothetical protein